MNMIGKIIRKFSLHFLLLILFQVSLNGQENIEKSESKTHWKGKKPVLILKENTSKVYTGKIVKLEKNGVIFDPKKESLIYDPPQKFYAFDDVETLIGNNGEFIIQNGQHYEKTFASEKNANATSQDDVNQNKYIFKHKIRLNVDYGYSSRRAKISSDIPPELKDYMNDLKSGTNFNVDFSYFISNQYGIGLKYSKFFTSGFIDGIAVTDPVSGTVLGIGMIEDNMSISFIGPAIFERRAVIPEKLLLIANLSVGQISYFDDGELLTYPIKLEGKTIGFSGTIGLDFLITKNFAIGINFSYLYGEIRNIKVNGESIDLDENESMNRWDFNIGFKLFQ
jgi:hypothetical protein